MWALLLRRCQMLCQGRASGRAGIGLDPSGEVSLVKLQPFLDVSAVFQRAAADTRVTSTLAAIMRDQPVLMPEKSKLNYKQRLAEGGDHFGLRDTVAAPAAKGGRGSVELGRFPIHNDYAYYHRQRCPPTALTSCIVLDDCTLDNGPLRMWPGTRPLKSSLFSLPFISQSSETGPAHHSSGQARTRITWSMTRTSSGCRSVRNCWRTARWIQRGGSSCWRRPAASSCSR